MVAFPHPYSKRLFFLNLLAACSGRAIHLCSPGLCLPLARPIRTQLPDRQPYITNGSILNVGTGAPDRRSAVPNGTVCAAVPDGAGG